MVQVSVTLLPFRAACRSVGGLGNSSEGACGGPIEAHPLNPTNDPSSNSPRKIFMQKDQTTSVPREALILGGAALPALRSATVLKRSRLQPRRNPKAGRREKDTERIITLQLRQGRHTIAPDVSPG